MKEKLKGSSFHKYIFFSFSMKKLQLEKMTGGWAGPGWASWGRGQVVLSPGPRPCASSREEAHPAVIPVPPAHPRWGPGMGHTGGRHQPRWLGTVTELHRGPRGSVHGLAGCRPGSPLELRPLGTVGSWD